MTGQRSTRFFPALTLALGLIAPAVSLSPFVKEARAGEPPPAASTSQAARAEGLFQEGKALLEQGRFAEACERLAKSDTLDPTISTLGLLAGCHEQQGRIAAALREYRATAKRAEAAGDSRAEFAKERATALEPRVPKLVIKVARSEAAMEVLRDLEPVPEGEIGVDVPVDPGAYEVVARASGMREFRATVTLREGEREVVSVPELVPPSGPPYPSSDAPPSRAAAIAPRVAAPVVPEAPSRGVSGRQVGAIAAGALGLVGAGVGVGFGVSALSKNVESSAIHQLCAPPAVCSKADKDKGQELRDGAYKAATLSTVGFGVGAAGLITGLVLVLLPQNKTASSSSASGDHTPARRVMIAPQIGAGERGAVLVGSF